MEDSLRSKPGREGLVRRIAGRVLARRYAAVFLGVRDRCVLQGMGARRAAFLGQEMATARLARELKWMAGMPLLWRLVAPERGREYDFAFMAKCTAAAYGMNDRVLAETPPAVSAAMLADNRQYRKASRTTLVDAIRDIWRLRRSRRITARMGHQP